MTEVLLCCLRWFAFEMVSSTGWRQRGQRKGNPLATIYAELSSQMCEKVFEPIFFSESKKIISAKGQGIGWSFRIRGPFWSSRVNTAKQQISFYVLPERQETVAIERQKNLEAIEILLTWVQLMGS
jgi:hypothetical protein